MAESCVGALISLSRKSNLRHCPVNSSWVCNVAVAECSPVIHESGGSRVLCVVLI